MGKRTEHAPGTFSWVDLATTDPDGAKRFYGSLFDWEYDDQDVGDGAIYTMVKVDGAGACAISGQIEQEREMGVPPHWNNYVTVEDADATAAGAKERGAQVLLDPFDVMDLGRMAVIQDPTGAVVSIWQPKANIGAEIVNVPGAMTWNELHTPDIDAAKSFYEDLFGWTISQMEGTAEGAPEYKVIRNGERANGGMMQAHGGVPPHWLPYFGTENLDETLEKVNSGGGEALTPVIDFPAGRIVAVRDPQGAAFSLWAGQMED
jgi:predicted enzyme related to lactoylglutathione lyase